MRAAGQSVFSQSSERGTIPPSDRTLHASMMAPMNGRTQLVDLVPRSNRFYVGLWLGGAAIVGVLEVLYALMPMLSPHTTDGRVATFDLDAEGSLAVWVSSFTLLGAAGCCLLTYVLQGGTKLQNRLWLWAASCWTIMSIDECSSVHEAFKEMMSHVTGERIWHDGTLWWVLAYFAVLSTTGLAMLWEMRKAPAAIGVLFGTAGFYAVAVLAELSWVLPKDKRGVMLEEGCEMLGNFCLLVSMGLFARYTAMNLRRRDDAILVARFAANEDAVFAVQAYAEQVEAVGAAN